VRRGKLIELTFVLQENGEELLHNTVDNVLRLRTHAHSLRAYVHGEDFGREDPNSGAPTGLVCIDVSGILWRCECMTTYRRKRKET
jgi:hypothetical protein